MELWTQKEAAARLKVSVSYLRASSCPKVLLPSLRPNGRPLVRYVPQDVEDWWRARLASPALQLHRSAA